MSEGWLISIRSSFSLYFVNRYIKRTLTFITYKVFWFQDVPLINIKGIHKSAVLCIMVIWLNWCNILVNHFRPNCSYIRRTSTPQLKASGQELNCVLENILCVYNILYCLYYENKDNDNVKVANS